MTHSREHLQEYLDGVVAGRYTQAQVALWTGYTREHICRLIKRYRQEGSSCLVNGHKGKPSPRAIPQSVKDKIVAIYRKDFVYDGEGTQFTVFRDCLELDYGISYSYRAVYDILTAAGEEFIPGFNARFAVPARKPPVWREPRSGWENMLCNRIERKANGAGIVSYMNHKLLVKADCACRNVELCVYRDKIRALYKGRFYDVALVEEPKGKSHAPFALKEIIAKTLKVEGKTGSD